MELQELPFKIQYRAGKENQVADYLSRNPGLTFDMRVNEEETFEDKIFTAGEGFGLYERIV